MATQETVESSNTTFAGEVKDYKIGKPIGQGKFATVFKAMDKNNQPVALKKIKIFDMQDQKQREKCLKEVKLMEPLKQPNIIQYLDSFIFNNELIIVTEWAENGDLKQLMRNQQQNGKSFDELQVWEYMNQIAGALVHMHEQRIMHRDLKPANIFIATDGSLKIGDLGLGRQFSSETIEAYSKVGTPLYMSPELLHGEGYDQKSDIWSLGCICYELCEFKSPFRNEKEKMSLMDLFNNITKGDFQSISKYKYSEQLSEILNQMIVVNPKDRVDGNYVVEKSSQMIKQLKLMKKYPKIDCMLVSDDIHEKLGLVGYHQNFCKPLNKIPVSKVYFAINEGSKNPTEKFFYFAELCYWIMVLPKYNKNNKSVAYKEIKTHLSYDTVEVCSAKLLKDIKQWGIKIPDQLNIDLLKKGYGDLTCFILNDLLNRELIRVNFKFEQPQLQENTQKEQESNELDNQDNLIEDKMESNLDENIIEDEDNQNNQQFNTSQNTLFMEQSMIEIQKLDEYKKMIQGNVNQKQWQKELQRVNKYLQQIQNNLNNNTEPGDNNYFTNLEQQNKYLQNVKTCCHIIQNNQSIINLQQKWEDQINQIQRGEKQINQSNTDKIEKLKISFNTKKIELEKLTLLSSSVNDNVKELDQLNEKFQELDSKIIEKSNTEQEGGQRKSQIKTAIADIKNEIRQLDLKKEIINQQLHKYYIKYKNQEDQINILNKDYNNNDYQDDDDDNEIEIDNF